MWVRSSAVSNIRTVLQFEGNSADTSHAARDARVRRDAGSNNARARHGRGTGAAFTPSLRQLSRHHHAPTHAPEPEIERSQGVVYVVVWGRPKSRPLPFEDEVGLSSYDFVNRTCSI